MVVISEEIKEKIVNNYYLYIILSNLRAYLTYFLNIISNYKLEKRRFLKVVGYKPNIKNPTTFSEKILWKKIFDRNPLLPKTADKYLVRTYVREILGEDIAKEILIPLLYVTDKPETIPLDDLALPYIIKPNHASGLNIIVKNGENNKKEIRRTCQKWLKAPYGLEKLEWAYQPIKRKIVIEKLLQDEDGNIPPDFKFRIFHGKCRSIRVITNRGNNPYNCFYDREWNFIAKTMANSSPISMIEKPKNYERMLSLAEKLAVGFDYVRVDFYNIKGRIYFGEITHYPKSGLIKSKPGFSDSESGEHWKIKPKYWIENVH